MVLLITFVLGVLAGAGFTAAYQIKHNMISGLDDVEPVKIVEEELPIKKEVKRKKPVVKKEAKVEVVEKPKRTRKTTKKA